MPPEPLPWDRRDFRKHERSGSDPRLGGGGGFGGGGPHRWRDQNHHPHSLPPYHQQQQRWYSDFRSSRPLPSSHGKQGAWHMYPDEGGNGLLPLGSRYGDRNLEEEKYRPFGSRCDGRYNRNNRENRGSFTQKDCKTRLLEPAASPSGPRRIPPDDVNPKSTENNQTCNNSSSKTCEASNPPSISLNWSDQPQSHVKVQDNKNDSTAVGPISPDLKLEKENCLGSVDWKPLKWTRPGSLSSRGPGFCHSSSSKSMGVDYTETVIEVSPKNAMPCQSPSAGAAACTAFTATALSDETSSRKKPRLGWGEGLAKYEKKKVEGPEDDTTTSGLVPRVIHSETLASRAVNQPEESSRAASLSNCASPATPSSVACSSSAGIEEKESIKGANFDNDTTTLSCTPSIVSHNHYDGPTFKLENFDTSIASLSSLINEVLQSDDSCPAANHYEQTTSMNKLLLWKVDVLKALETTESEIDSLETELKSLRAESKSSCPYSAAPSLLSGECPLRPREELITASKFGIRPAPLHVVSSGDIVVQNPPVAVDDQQVGLKDEDIDSPGSATSKFVEVLPCGKDLFSSETEECLESFMNVDVKNPSNLDEKCSRNDPTDGETTSRAYDYVLVGTNNCEDLASLSNLHFYVDNVYHSILSSNKDSANRALEELNKLLPAKKCISDIMAPCSVSSRKRDSSVVKEKFLSRKRFLQFKEKVVTLKFNVLQHFWKEGRHVSLRKLRLKAQKKSDLSRTGHKKSRFRTSSSAGGSQPAPSDEVIEFVNGLLAKLAFKLHRNTLKMPALILDKEMKMSRFISNNGLVEDPCAVEKERSIINPWTLEEREIFLDKLAAFGKDFQKIASFLDHKTIADCIEFYYKNHKSECFEKTRMKCKFTKQRKSQSSIYLVASRKRWNRESNAASLDMLGAASAIAADVKDGLEIQHNCTSIFFLSGSSSCKASVVGDVPLQTSNSPEMHINERETAAADALAGICGSLSSEAIGSSITSSFDPGDRNEDERCKRVCSSIKWPLTPENVDDGCSDESSEELDPTDWTDEEKAIFVRAVSFYGKDFMLISRCVRTKSVDQCRVFFSKARKSLRLDLILPEAVNVASGDDSDGDSDVADACAVESGCVICSSGSECKMEADVPPLDMKLNHDPVIVGLQKLRADSNLCHENNVRGRIDPMDAVPICRNLSTGDGQVDIKPVADYNVETEKQNRANHVSIHAVEFGIMAVSSGTESERGVEVEDGLGLSNGSCKDENKVSVEVLDHGEENETRGFMFPEGSLDNDKVDDIDAKSEPQLAANVSHPSVIAHSSVQVDSCQENVGLEIPKTFGITSLEQNAHIASADSPTLFSVPVKYQENPNHSALFAIGRNKISDDMNSQKTVGTDDNRPNRLGHSLSDSVSSGFSKGCPGSVRTAEELNGDVNCKNLVPTQNATKRDEKLHSGRHTDFSLQMCNVSVRVAEAPRPSLEQCRDLSGPQSSCSSDVDKPSRNGDVKLFGKILVSSQQKPDSCAQRADGDDNGQHHRTGCQSSNMELSAGQTVCLDSARFELDCDSRLGSENIPVSCYSFWNGNMIKKGFPPLPDSSVLTRYPSAFVDCGEPIVKYEESPLHGDVRSSDCPLNGHACFSKQWISRLSGV